MLNPPQDLLDLVSTQVDVQKPEGDFVVERSIGSSEPLHCLLFSAQQRQRLRRDTCQAVQTIGFAGGKCSAASASRECSEGHTKDARHFRH